MEKDGNAAGGRGLGPGPPGAAEGAEGASLSRASWPAGAAHSGAASSSRAPAGCRCPSAPDAAPSAPRPGPVNPVPGACPRPRPAGASAHLARARLGGAPGTRAALRAPARLRRPWARRGPAQPGQGPGERAGRVAVAAVAAANAAGSARSGRGARTAGGHVRSRRASQPRDSAGAAGRFRRGSGSGSGSGVRRPAGRCWGEPARPPRSAASDRPGAEGGAAGGDEVMPSEKSP